MAREEYEAKIKSAYGSVRKGNTQDKTNAKSFKKALGLAEQIKGIFEGVGGDVPHDAMRQFPIFYKNLQADVKIMERYAASGKY